MILSSILTLSLFNQSQSLLSVLQSGTNPAGVKASLNDIVTFDGTIEFVGSATVPNSVNVTATYKIRLKNVLLQPRKANWFDHFVLIGDDRKEYVAMISREAQTGLSIFNNPELLTFDNAIKRPYSAKQTVGFTFNSNQVWGTDIAILFGDKMVLPPGFKKDVVNKFGPNTPARLVRITLYPTSVAPKTVKVTTVKATTASAANQVGFTTKDSITVKRTHIKPDQFGPTEEVLSAEDLHQIFENPLWSWGQVLNGMKIGEIRQLEFSDSVEQIELVKVTKG